MVFMGTPNKSALLQRRQHYAGQEVLHDMQRSISTTLTAGELSWPVLAVVFMGRPNN
jgi:hypothetical protein